MGGVTINTDGQVTDADGKAIEGLFAAGEVTGGVHGGNRLASNSLLEALVYSRTAAEDITRKLQKYGRKPLGLEPAHRPITGKKMPSGFRSQIRAILQDTYFVLPKPEKYDESYKKVEEIIKQLFSESYEISSDLVEAKSIAVVASIILDEVREGQS